MKPVAPTRSTSAELSAATAAQTIASNIKTAGSSFSGVNLDEAVALIQKAIELDPDNGAYIDSLGWAYYKKGMTSEAFKELEKAIKLEPKDPDIKGHFEAIKKKMKR